MAFQDFPDEIFVARGAGRAMCRKAEGLFAVHGRPPLPGLTVEMTLEDPAITVYRGSAAEAGPGDSAVMTPVYEMEGGTLGVPTGLVFVRFAGGTDASTRAPDVSALGFTIDNVPGYARNAAWLRPASGDTADALRRLPRLEALDGVAAVEPQLVMPAARR